MKYRTQIDDQLFIYRHKKSIGVSDEYRYKYMNTK